MLISNLSRFKYETNIMLLLFLTCKYDAFNTEKHQLHLYFNILLFWGLLIWITKLHASRDWNTEPVNLVHYNNKLQ